MALPFLLGPALVCGLAFAALRRFPSYRSRIVDVDHFETIVYRVADLPVWRRSAGFPAVYDGSLLSARIRDSVDPGSWAHGFIRERKDSAALVIRQTPANHRRIATMLDRLRRRRQIALARRDAVN